MKFAHALMCIVKDLGHINMIVRLCNNIVSALYKTGGSILKETRVYILTSSLRICLYLFNKSLTISIKQVEAFRKQQQSII